MERKTLSVQELGAMWARPTVQTPPEARVSNRYALEQYLQEWRDQFYAYFNREAGGERAILPLGRIVMLTDLIEQSFYKPRLHKDAQNRLRKARIALAHNFTVLADLGYGEIAIDEVKRVVGRESEAEKMRQVGELQGAVRLREAASRFPESAEAIGENYWPIVRKVFVI